VKDQLRATLSEPSPPSTDPVAQPLVRLDHQLAARGWLGVPVGGDHPLADAPGGLDLDVHIDGEQRRESGGLLVGEQVGPGVQGSPGTVERVVLTAAAAGRGGSSPLAVAEKKGTMILLALGRARWASEIWGVILLPPLWLTWDLAGRGRWLSLIRPLLGSSGRQGRALG
jgi:hypothetical protein